MVFKLPLNSWSGQSVFLISGFGTIHWRVDQTRFKYKDKSTSNDTFPAQAALLAFYYSAGLDDLRPS